LPALPSPPLLDVAVLTLDVELAREFDDAAAIALAVRRSLRT
jgi:hypothetical protein